MKNNSELELPADPRRVVCHFVCARACVCMCVCVCVRVFFIYFFIETSPFKTCFVQHAGRNDENKNPKSRILTDGCSPVSFPPPATSIKSNKGYIRADTSGREKRSKLMAAATPLPSPRAHLHAVRVLRSMLLT